MFYFQAAARAPAKDEFDSDDSEGGFEEDEDESEEEEDSDFEDPGKDSVIRRYRDSKRYRLLSVLINREYRQRFLSF